MSTPSVARITQIQIDAVTRWHDGPLDNPHDAFEAIVCDQHQYNFQLWHQEDIARSPTADDAQIAKVKRTIDTLNQARNDLIEKIDDALTNQITTLSIRVAPDAPINTETPGSAIDRLSIMALRLYHYREQLQRDDVDQSHLATVQSRLDLCHQQHADLSNALQRLLDDIFGGRTRHKTYRQMKMYNDPSLNPQIYDSSS